MHRSFGVAVCALLACSPDGMTAEGSQAPSMPELKVQITSVDPAAKRVVATVTNVSGETLLVPICVGGLQRQTATSWEHLDDARMCPGGVFESMAPGSARVLELRLPANAPECKYRVVASAARAQAAAGESDIVELRARLTESPSFCLVES